MGLSRKWRLLPFAVEVFFYAQASIWKFAAEAACGLAAGTEGFTCEAVCGPRSG
ncbi:MAG: hypothetical protein HFH87_06825 [Lachnospiraceae bacterium]|nr:hypothetical protein [Lachnospiraceae bacterium]